MKGFIEIIEKSELSMLRVSRDLYKCWHLVIVVWKNQTKDSVSPSLHCKLVNVPGAICEVLVESLIEPFAEKLLYSTGPAVLEFKS
ncbi:hypothetical protein [uncultured Kiloniella sp.]|uniref:hypothetical protein n=1 Tax=uncultured Kiloniella sp. TaxID=1133091 RepID=UPI00262EBF47|nr:hypothetical protein [uncultured Kiloniella sp.]